jgi:hypothetical protein
MKLQDLLRHIADNVENGRIWSEGLDIDDEAAWAASVFFGNAGSVKLTPRTHVINGFTVPAPVGGDLGGVQGCWLTDITCPEWAYGVCWVGDNQQTDWLNRGLIHLRKEAAIANAKAMLGIDPDKD